MQYFNLIQLSLDYIEENLTAEITAEELSMQAGFSVYHYCRLFQSAVGMPVKQYITKRRLLWAAFDMANGSKKIDSALKYGFDTSPGFYKAFMREFGCSPSSYGKLFRARKPYRINLLREEHIMITQKKTAKILENWDMPGVSVTSAICSSGIISENTFYVGDEYVLKAYVNLGTAQKNIKIAAALNEAQLSQAKLIKTKSGEDYAADGELYFVLAERIKGECIMTKELYNGDSRKSGEYIGEIIGRLHTVLKESNDIVCNARNIFEEARACLFQVKNTVTLPQGFCKNYLEATERFNGKLPVQLIHRDLNPGNIILKNGKLAGFIDFDLSQRSIRLFDPCYAATGIISESLDMSDDEKYSKWFDLFGGIIHGYDSIVHLTEDEKEAVPYVVFSIQLICIACFENTEKYKELAKVNTDIINRLIEERNNLRTKTS